jgi:hypothetical protein
LLTQSYLSTLSVLLKQKSKETTFMGCDQSIPVESATEENKTAGGTSNLNNAIPDPAIFNFVGNGGGDAGGCGGGACDFGGGGDLDWNGCCDCLGSISCP